MKINPCPLTNYVFILFLFRAVKVIGGKNRDPFGSALIEIVRHEQMAETPDE